MRTLISIGIGIAIVHFAPHVAPYFDRDTLGIAVFGYFILALGFYQMRCSYGILYGITELVIVICAITVATNFYFGAMIAASGLLPDLTPGPIGIIAVTSVNFYLFQIAVAVYIVIRGLDNIGEGLRQRTDHPNWSRLWCQCFDRR